MLDTFVLKDENTVLYRDIYEFKLNYDTKGDLMSFMYFVSQLDPTDNEIHLKIKILSQENNIVLKYVKIKNNKFLYVKDNIIFNDYYGTKNLGKNLSEMIKVTDGYKTISVIKHEDNYQVNKYHNIKRKMMEYENDECVCVKYMTTLDKMNGFIMITVYKTHYDYMMVTYEPNVKNITKGIKFNREIDLKFLDNNNINDYKMVTLTEHHNI